MERIDFNEGWLFKKYGWDSWENVTLPHDAMLLEGRHPDSPSSCGGGFFMGGIYIYEKKLRIPSEWKDKHLELEFEGISGITEIAIDGHVAVCQENSYLPTVVSLDRFRPYADEYTVTVKVDNSQIPNSRWYSGSGIYRKAFLYVMPKAYIQRNSVQIKTEAFHPAVVSVSAKAHGEGELYVEILDKDTVVAKCSGSENHIEISHAKLWSDRSPYLYKCRISLRMKNNVLDSAEYMFGIRVVEWGAQGLFVNGKETLLRGGAVHHDNGILGACCYDSAEWRKVRILKENGYNALRSAHNPCSKAILDACDFYGVYVMDETWDMWYNHKNKYDYATYFEKNYNRDIINIVEKDYNHPSVIMYSIGNELTEPIEARGLKFVKKIKSIFHSLDDTRPITAGVNLTLLHLAAKGIGIYKEDGSSPVQSAKSSDGGSSTFFNMLTYMVGNGMQKIPKLNRVDKSTSPFLDELDIAGYNYATGRYPLDGKKHPDRCIVGTETFTQDIARNWRMVRKYPYLIGDFCWTAWDYLGETGIGAWSYSADARNMKKPYPWLLSDVGAIDILGHAGAPAAFSKTVWEDRLKPYIYVAPPNKSEQKLNKSAWRGTNGIASWSWNGYEGTETVVEVFSAADEVKLYLNGVLIGRQRIKDYKASFKIRYHPGKLQAVAYIRKNPVGRTTLFSARDEIKINIKAEKQEGPRDGLVYVTVDITDDSGRIASSCDKNLKLKVEGGRLLGFGSANPRTTESFLSGNYRTYFGRAMAVLRPYPGETLTLSVLSDDGLSAKHVIYG